MSFYPGNGFCPRSPGFYVNQQAFRQAWRDSQPDAFPQHNYLFSAQGRQIRPPLPYQVIPSSVSSDCFSSEATERMINGLEKKLETVPTMGRPKKNPVWTLFQLVDDRNALCSMCQRVIQSACATNMTKHLDRHHAGVTKSLETGCHGSPEKLNKVEHRNYTLTTIKRYKVTKHPAWVFFEQCQNGAATCRICQVSVRSPCSSNFMGHLLRHHPAEHAEIQIMWKKNQFCEKKVIQVPTVMEIEPAVAVVENIESNVDLDITSV